VICWGRWCSRYEVQCRLCDAASLRARGWDHVTYGAISTALLSGKLLGLSAEQLRHALALAAIPNVALRQTRSGELSMWKGCAFANAARNGVFAALLAGEGVTGPWEVFEGEFGFWKQVAGPFALPPLAGVTGDDWMILQTYIKFWPVEYHAQSAVDAALQLRSKIDITQIERIEIASFDAAVDIIGKDPEKYRPRSRETADHSMPYCVAIALTGRRRHCRAFRTALAGPSARCQPAAAHHDAARPGAQRRLPGGHPQPAAHHPGGRQGSRTGGPLSPRARP